MMSTVTPTPDRLVTLDWWVSCKWFTCWVQTDQSGRILGSAPIVQKFKGQSMYRLIAWSDATAIPLWGRDLLPAAGEMQP